MKKSYINLGIIFTLIVIFALSKKRQISIISENELCCTKFDNASIYHGPSIQTKKARIILKKNYPLFVIKNKKGWVKVIDPQNRIGWINKSNLKKEQRIFVKNKMILPKEQIILLPELSLKLISKDNKNCVVKLKDKNISIPIENVWIGIDKIQ